MGRVRRRLSKISERTSERWDQFFDWAYALDGRYRAWIIEHTHQPPRSKQMTKIVALDTETTGLDPKTERVFEIATVDLTTKEERVWTIEPPPDVVKNMHPAAVAVNRYHERTGADGWIWDVEYDHGYDPDTLNRVLEQIRGVLEGAHVLGAVPDFDTRFITELYRWFGLDAPRWHYHLIDIEAVAVGFLQAMKNMGQMMRSKEVEERYTIELPWSSDMLSLLCDVLPPRAEERHMALADARWAARWYQHIMADQPEHMRWLPDPSES